MLTTTSHIGSTCLSKKTPGCSGNPSSVTSNLTSYSGCGPRSSTSGQHALQSCAIAFQEQDVWNATQFFHSVWHSVTTRVPLHSFPTHKKTFHAYGIRATSPKRAGECTNSYAKPVERGAVVVNRIKTLFRQTNNVFLHPLLVRITVTASDVLSHTRSKMMQDILRHSTVHKTLDSGDMCLWFVFFWSGTRESDLTFFFKSRWIKPLP